MKGPAPKRILFLTRSLNYGGSERQLVSLAKELFRQNESVGVATFYKGGDLRVELEREGIPTFSLDKRGRWDIFRFYFNTIGLLREVEPEILYGFVGTANILSIFLRVLYPKIKIVWGIRASNTDLRLYGWFEQFLYRVEIMFSRFADLIIVNSYAGFDYAKLNGFPTEKMIVILNGIDTAKFYPDASLCGEIRSQWKAGSNEKVIGLVGRLDPLKDHPTFLKAAALYSQERKDVRFVCIGDGPPAYRLQLQELSRDLGLGNCLTWVEARNDLTAVYNALDVATSSSYGEGFSNVIGEAMACGVPCVVTDIGDSSRIVGDTGEIVSARNPEALVDGWRRMFRRLETRPSLQEEVRERIIQHFDLDSLLAKTNSALNSLSPESY